MPTSPLRPRPVDLDPSQGVIRPPQRGLAAPLADALEIKLAQPGIQKKCGLKRPATPEDLNAVGPLIFSRKAHKRATTAQIPKLKLAADLEQVTARSRAATRLRRHCLGVPTDAQLTRLLQPVAVAELPSLVAALELLQPSQARFLSCLQGLLTIPGPQRLTLLQALQALCDESVQPDSLVRLMQALTAHTQAGPSSADTLLPALQVLAGPTKLALQPLHALWMSVEGLPCATRQQTCQLWALAFGTWFPANLMALSLAGLQGQHGAEDPARWLGLLKTVFARERQTPYADLSPATQFSVEEALVALRWPDQEQHVAGRDAQPRRSAALRELAPYFADLVDDSMDCVRRAMRLQRLVARGENIGNFCEVASMLVCKEDDLEVRTRLLNALYQSEDYENLAEALSTANDYCGIPFSDLLGAFVGLTGAQALQLSLWTRPLQDSLSAQNVCRMLRELRDVPDTQRLDFIEFYTNVLHEIDDPFPWRTSHRLKLILALHRCDERQELAAALCQILSTRDADLEELLQVFEDISGTEVLRLSRWAESLYRAIDADNVPQLLGRLLNLPPAEQLPFVEVCQPLIASTNNRDFLADMLVGLTDTSAERRLSTVRMLLQARDTNNENVMLASRNKHTRDAIVMLRNYFPAPLNTEEILAQISGFLRRIRLKQPHHPVYFRRRAGASELDNAEWVLQGNQVQYNDYTTCLQSNPEVNLMGESVWLGDLCAQVWHAIGQYNAAPTAELCRSHRHSMRHSMVLALAQCREDDGHRVCGVGVSQRLLTVLQGYYPGIYVDRPEPQALLCDVAKEFMAARAEPESDCSEAEVAQFKIAALRSARHYFSLNSEEMAVFVNQLDDYVQTL